MIYVYRKIKKIIYKKNKIQYYNMNYYYINEWWEQGLRKRSML